MRFAMRDMLRHPPAGFEGAVAAHFRLVRPLLVRQCARWLAECKSAQTKVAMEKAWADIRTLLDALDAPAGGAASSAAVAAGSEAVDCD